MKKIEIVMNAQYEKFYIDDFSKLVSIDGTYKFELSDFLGIYGNKIMKASFIDNLYDYYDEKTDDVFKSIRPNSLKRIRELPFNYSHFISIFDTKNSIELLEKIVKPIDIETKKILEENNYITPDNSFTTICQITNCNNYKTNYYVLVSSKSIENNKSVMIEYIKRNIAEGNYEI